MSRIADSTRSEVHLGVEDAPERRELDPDRPFRILLAGDFSGRSWREGSPRSFTPRRIDRDNFDEVLEEMSVTLNLHGIPLSFRELDDFHPDHIYRAAAVFQNLDQYLDARAAPAPPAAASSAAAAPKAASVAPGAGLLEQMFAEHGEEPAPRRPVSVEDANDLVAFIQRITVGHLEPRPDPVERQRTARRQSLAGEILRGLLHHPRMQAIEAAWRAAYLLVRDLETDGDLQLYLLDVTLPELVSDMDAIHVKLRRAGPWAAIAGNYTFGQSELDARVLRLLAGLARALGAPFLAEGRLAQEDAGAGTAWPELRRSAAARWLGLALPRFLLRLPYGKGTNPIESFPFEEMPESQHAAYLWGNPAFFCAYLLGKSFEARGWQLASRLERRIDGLPLYVYREDGQPVSKPCAEMLITEHDAEELLDAGYMPVASIKDQPAALLVRFQSIAQPAATLAGLT